MILTQLIQDQFELPPCSFRTNWVLSRASRGPLFHKQETSRALFCKLGLALVCVVYLQITFFGMSQFGCGVSLKMGQNYFYCFQSQNSHNLLHISINENYFQKDFR